MRRCLLFLLLFFCLLCLASCQTRAVETEKMDLSPMINPVLQLKPDNSQFVIKTDIVDVYDVVENSTQYLLAWELWQGYAEALETTLQDIGAYVDGS